MAERTVPVDISGVMTYVRAAVEDIAANRFTDAIRAHAMAMYMYGVIREKDKTVDDLLVDLEETICHGVASIQRSAEREATTVNKIEESIRELKKVLPHLSKLGLPPPDVH